jgi:hypothetical protein
MPKKIAGVGNMARQDQRRDERLPIMQGSVQVMNEQGRVTKFAFDNGAEGEKIWSFHAARLYQQKTSR